MFAIRGYLEIDICFMHMSRQANFVDVYMHLDVYTQTHIRTCMCVGMYVCMYVRMYVCMYVCM